MEYGEVIEESIVFIYFFFLLLMGLKHLVYRVVKFQFADGALGLESMEQVTQSTIFAKISF